MLSVLFTITGNPHRSLSELIPNSVQPWVYISPWRQLQRGAETRELLRTIPRDASVAAETHLVPLLAERRVLLRFPENSAYTDEQQQERPAAWIVSQPGFNAAYAPAFRGNGAWVRRSQVKIQALLASGDYRVHRCDQRGIVLRHVSAVTDPKGEPSAEAGASCVRQQFEKARAQMQREGDASKR